MLKRTITILFPIMFILVFYIYLSKVSNDDQVIEWMKMDINHALLEYYAEYGVYPEDVKMLEMYGIILDYEHFDIEYERYAKNLLPRFEVKIHENN